MKKKNRLLISRPLGISKQNLLRMKFCVLFLFIAVIQLNASVFSQSVKLNFSLNEATLNHAFKQIEAQSEFKFIYNNEDVDQFQNVNADFESAEIEDVLDALLKDTKLDYRFENDLIIIYTNDKKTEPKPSQQEKITIKGSVVDKDNGISLPGATVLEDGTTNGTITDQDGKFTISVAGPDAVLVFSFVGYEHHEVRVGDKKVLFVSLEVGNQEINEVIVSTGYQEIEKERMTGSTSTITAREISNKGFSSIEEVLEGTVAGLTAISTGRPGEDAQITIRGVNSLTGDTNPIWIVDGMPLQGDIPNISDGANDIQSTIFTTGIGNLTPDDIKSITVLKDAAATAIYGARAANGVIVIETKSGTVGKTYFNATAQYGITEKPASDIRMMNTAQKIQFEKDLYADLRRYQNYGRVFNLMRAVNYGKISQQEADAQIADLSRVETDWFDEIFRVGNSKRVGLSMRGGTEETQYYVSSNYLSEKGIEPNNKYERMGLTMKLTHNPTKNVRINLGLTGSLRNDRSNASYVDPLRYAMYANPYEKPYNDDGTYAYDLSYNVSESSLRDGFAWGKFNIIKELNENVNNSKYLSAQTNLKVEWELLPGLMLTTHGSYSASSNHSIREEGVDTYTNFRNNWLNPAFGNEVPHELVRGSLRESTGRSTEYTWRNTVSFNKEINDVHFISLFGGQEISNTYTNNFYNYSPVYDKIHRIVGFPELGDVRVTSLKMNELGGTGVLEEKYSSFFLNGSYSYQDKYIVSASVRYDGSDIIGNDNQFTPLWNVAGRWNLHNEEFIGKYSFVNELAVRAGFGYTGSIDKKALPFLVMKVGNVLNYDGQVVPTEYNYPNPNVKWQTKKDINFGIDLALFDNRLELSTNYYHNKTMDVLDRRKLPYSSGRGVVRENVADILNKGWEISLSTTNIKTQDFRWITRLILSTNENEVVKTYLSSLGEVGKTKQHEFVVGYPVNAWYGYNFAGVDFANGNSLVKKDDGSIANLDDVYSNSYLNIGPPPVSYLGEAYPPITGGFINTFIYKRLTLTANFEFKAGHTIRSFNTHEGMSSTNRYYTDTYRWLQPGDVTIVPAFTGNTKYAYNTYFFDQKLEDGDYLRLNLLTLGYNVDPQFAQKLGFKNVRINATGRNLLVLTKYNGIDPALMGAFDYPNTRSYMISVNLGF